MGIIIHKQILVADTLNVPAIRYLLEIQMEMLIQNQHTQVCSLGMISALEIYIWELLV